MDLAANNSLSNTHEDDDEEKKGNVGDNKQRKEPLIMTRDVNTNLYHPPIEKTLGVSYTGRCTYCPMCLYTFFLTNLRCYNITLYRHQLSQFITLKSHINSPVERMKLLH